MGYSKEQVIRAFSEVSKKSPNEEPSSLWLSVLCCLREVEVYSSPLTSQNVPKVKHHHPSSNSFTHKETTQLPTSIKPCSSSVNVDLTFFQNLESFEFIIIFLLFFLMFVIGRECEEEK